MCVQFLTVWGTGEKGAEAWWSQGCRTLDDLRARSDLSAQQVLHASHTGTCNQRIIPHHICPKSAEDPKAGSVTQAEGGRCGGL